MSRFSGNQMSARFVLLLLASLVYCTAKGQQTPLNPVSYWAFNPWLYNPAIVGSKDFLSIGFNASFRGKSNTQLLSGNTRILRTGSGYISSPRVAEYSNLGIGGSVFRDINGTSQNVGVSFAASYQIPLNSEKLSFLSFGASVKGISNTLRSDTTEPSLINKKTIYPNLDVGIYYYGINFFSGFSATDILGNPGKPDSLGNYRIPVSRMYYFTAGFKILLSRSLNVVVEPSILITASDSSFRNMSDNLNPVVKLYLGDFCIGTSFHYKDRISVFSQFRYPRFYVGAYYEFSNKTAYFKNHPTLEFTLGINIQASGSRFPNHSHW